MKTAKEWQELLRGETSQESIAAIQADALGHALVLLTVNAHSPALGFQLIHELQYRCERERGHPDT